MMEIMNGRNFQLWEYSVTHGQLLIRSPKNNIQEFNVDILFSGVEYISSPRHLKDIKLDSPTDEELRTFENMLNKSLKKNNIHILESNQFRYVIIAASAKVEKSESDIFESPF